MVLKLGRINSSRPSRCGFYFGEQFISGSTRCFQLLLIANSKESKIIKTFSLDKWHGFLSIDIAVDKILQLWRAKVHKHIMRQTGHTGQQLGFSTSLTNWVNKINPLNENGQCY